MQAPINSYYNDMVLCRNDVLKAGIKLAHKHNCTELHIAFDTEDFTPLPMNESTFLDLTPLQNFPEVTMLHIHPRGLEKITGFDVLYELPNLKELAFSWGDDWTKLVVEQLDLGKLKHLQKFETVWNKHIVNLDSCSALEKLELWKYSAQDLSVIAKLSNLKELLLVRPKLKTADFPEGQLNSLEKIDISYARAIESIDALGQCAKLKRIHIEKCPSLWDINLRSSSLTSMTLDRVSSLSFLVQLPNLDALCFSEYKEGDMSPIMNSNITNIGFHGNKPHYTHTEKELQAFIQAKQ